MLRNLIDGLLGRPAPAAVGELVDEGNRLAAQGEHERALACYDRALAQDASLAVAQNNRSLSLFALGRTKEAWIASEARFQLQEKTRRFAAAPPVPRWDGAPLAGRLLVLWEQGLGDVLQHLRFLPGAAARVGGLAFLCPAPLAGLVAHSFPGIEVLVARKGWSPDWRSYVAHVPLLSLPLALDADPDALPAPPYLRAPGAQPRGERRARLELGLVWRTSGDEPHRDCPLEDLLALAGDGVRLVSMQFAPTEAERAVLAREGIEERVGDFLYTADAVLGVDAVVTADTAMLHLAGALGRPVHGLLNEPYSVRWTQSGSRTPWYPSARLHRKRAGEPWRVAIDRAARALRENRAWD